LQAEPDLLGDIKPETVGDVSGQTAPAAFSLLSLHSTSQLWPNSAPELLTIEQLNPTDSNPTSYCEVQLLLFRRTLQYWSLSVPACVMCIAVLYGTSTVLQVVCTQLVIFLYFATYMCVVVGYAQCPPL